MSASLRSFYTKHPRLFTTIELLIVVVLFAALFWGFAFRTNPFQFLVTTAFLIIIVVLTSILTRKDSLKNLGLRFDNLGLSLRDAGLVLALFAGVVVIVAYMRRSPVDRMDLEHLATYIVRGFVQELIFLSYFYVRFYSIFTKKLPTIFSTAGLFAALHFPDLSFVAIAFGLGTLFSYLFSRHRNVFVIGLLHGLIVVLIIMFLRPIGLFSQLKIGPRTLTEISSVLNQEWQVGEPIRLGSHELIPRAVGEEWEERITEMYPGYSVRTEDERRELLKDYLSSKDRVFCLITRKDYEKLISPTFRGNLTVLAKGYILRRRFRFGEIKEAVLTDGDLAGYVVQEVYLVSNYPSVPTH